MKSSAHMPLGRVWLIAVATFVLAAFASHKLTKLTSPMPAYWVGDIGFVALAVALVLSWRGLGAAGAHSTSERRVLRGLVVSGALLWVVLMVFPFL